MLLAYYIDRYKIVKRKWYKKEKFDELNNMYNLFVILQYMYFKSDGKLFNKQSSYYMIWETMLKIDIL